MQTSNHISLNSSSSNHSIQQMSHQEMRQLLLQMHSKGMLPRPITINKIQKTKFIAKTLNKTNLKSYVCDRIVRKGKRKGSGGSVRGMQMRREGEKEGKLNFESSTQVQNNLQIHKKTLFSDNIQHSLTQTQNDELICSICLQLFICPALTPCGHTFCYRCLDQSLLFSANCPNCRQNIRGCEPVICSVLDRLIRFKNQLESHKLEEYEHYLGRVSKFESWRANRCLNYDLVREGDMIDVRDTETIWCQGKVEAVYQKLDKKLNKKVVTGILVHYNRWNSIYNQIIDVPSNRFAPLSYFSSRAEIPHYNLAEAEGNIRGSVIHGPVRLEPQRPVHYIRIEESSESLVSDIVEIEEDSQNYSRLAPNRRMSFEESPVHNLENESSSEMGIGDYMEQVRRNVLRRLGPEFNRERDDNQSELEMDSFYANQTISDHEDEDGVYGPPNTPVESQFNEVYQLPEEDDSHYYEPYEPPSPIQNLSESNSQSQEAFNHRLQGDSIDEFDKLLQENEQSFQRSFDPMLGEDDHSNRLEEYE